MSTCMTEECISQTILGELHTSAATPPSFLFPVASTTALVGHNIFTSIVDRHKIITSHGLESEATEAVFCA